MDSGVELTSFTKAMEYLLSIAFLVAFIAFWQLVYGKGRGVAVRIAVLLFLGLGPALLAASCLTTVPR